MNQNLIKIFKKVVDDDPTVKGDVFDYLVTHGGTAAASVTSASSRATIVVGSQYNYEISLKRYCEVAFFLAKGQKINAIRALRAETGLGPKDAKDAVYLEWNWPMPMQR